MESMIRPEDLNKKFTLEIWTLGVRRGEETIPKGRIQERMEELFQEDPVLKQNWESQPWGYHTQHTQGRDVWYYQFIYG